MRNIVKFSKFFEAKETLKKINIGQFEAYCLIVNYNNKNSNWYREYSGIKDFYKTDYGILVKSNNGGEIKVTDKTLTYNGDEAFIFSHYMKPTSKFYRDSETGKRFYDNINKYFPENNIVFITPDKLKEDGWRQSKMIELRLVEDNKITSMLYDDNCAVFIKDDKYFMIFDFNMYKLKVYDSMGLSEPKQSYMLPTIYPGKLLYEKEIRNKDDYNEFLNKFN